MEVAWSITLVLCAILFVAFTFVVAFGAPFLPTLAKRVDDAISLLDLKEGDTLLELGSGDGRILRAAAERGIRGIGFELNPLLVVYSRIVTFKYRKLITIKWGNYWNKNLPKTEGIFVFLLQPYMEKLDNKIVQNYPAGVRLVSFAFTIPGRKPTRKSDGMYLYVYPKQLKKAAR